MEKQKYSEILEKTDGLVSLIKESSDYKRYLSLEKKMKENSKIMGLVNEIKSLQKEIVKREYKKMPISELEDKIESNLKELSTYQIYTEYTYLQEDLNEMFQNIKYVIEHFIEEKIK